MSDARLSTAFPAHPKTKKLHRRLGDAGPLACIYLFLWASQNRSDGDLSGMSDEDIELAIDWRGEPDAFVRAMVDVGYLDGDQFERRIHDWQDHNPWAAGAEMRSAKARWNAVKRHHGEREADRQVPEYAAVRAASTESDASSNASSKLAARKSDAPSPSPSPSPSLSSSDRSTQPTRDARTPAHGSDLIGQFEGHDSPRPAAPNPAAPFAIALNGAGFRCTAMNPDLQAYAAEGGTVDHLRDIAAHPDCAGKSATYVVRFARRELADRPKPVTPSARAGPNGHAAPASKSVQALQALEALKSHDPLAPDRNRDRPAEAALALARPDPLR